ncbi:MAG TPA: patatin-like phospholipase family protein [Hyphomicrobiaceae bacterium]|nr:patatin-like phospholipase family protein [Hyphomicrobiaceae bacterium]
MAGTRIGIALGGGAARGWAHIGVLRALLEAGIVPDLIAGTSIGAVVGGCFAAGKLAELEAFARGLTRRKVFGYLDFNFAGTGLITGQRLCDRLLEHLGDRTIEDLPVPFTAVATEIGSGHEVWLSRGPMVDAIRASYALPGIFRPVRINGRWLFDGALVNPIPVTVCRAMGARYVIAVNLNTDLYGRGTVLPEIAAREVEDAPAETLAEAKGNGRSALKLLQRQLFGRGEDVPGISTVMIDAFNIVQDRTARSRLAGDPPDAIITPRLGGIGPFDFYRADELIARGHAAVQRELEDLVHELNLRSRLAPKVAVPN